MPFAAFCDELKVFSSDEPYALSSSVRVTEKPDLYGNISWSGDATWLTVTPSNDPLAIFKYENGQLLPHRFLSFSHVRSATFLNWTNKDLVFGLENGEIRMWNIREKAVSCKIDSGPKQPVNFLTCNLDDTCIASGSLKSNKIGLHSLKSNKYLQSLELPKGELTSCLRFCQCKKGYLAASTSASTIYVWDVVKSQCIFKPANAHQGACSGIEFSPINFSVLATISLSQRLKLFDLRKNNRILDIQLNEPLHCVDIFQQGDKVAVGTSKGNIIIYDLRASKIDTTIKAYNDVVTAISINKLERIRKEHSSEMNSSEAPALANRTLDLSVMDVFSPIARDNSNGHGGNMTNSSADNTQGFVVPGATPARAQNDSFLSRMLSPRPAPILMSSPIIDPTAPAPQPGQLTISINQPQTVHQNLSSNSPQALQQNISLNQSPTCQQNVTLNASPTSQQAITLNSSPTVQQTIALNPPNMVRPNGLVHPLQVFPINPYAMIQPSVPVIASQPNNMSQAANASSRFSQQQGQSQCAGGGATLQGRQESLQRDFCMDTILRELNHIQEEQDVSFKLLSDQMTLLEDTLMNRVATNHDTITDILLNVIKKDVEKCSFETRYELVTQRNSHMDCFNMLIERTENMAMLLAELTQQVAALQNSILNHNRS